MALEKFVLAGDHREYKTYLREHRLSPSSAPYVYDYRTLQGCRGKSMVLYGTYRNRRDFPEVLHMAKAYGIEVNDALG